MTATLNFSFQKEEIIMSEKSQEKNMRKLADLLSYDLGYIWGEKERGPNGDKKVFLNTGKAFLRALAKDLGLRDVKVCDNPGGIAVSGECSLIGMWDAGGIYIMLSQPCYDRERVLLYRTVRHKSDYTGGKNHFLTRSDLAQMKYGQLIEIFSSLKKEGASYERAA